MAEPKTRKNKASVKDFVASVENEQRRRDCAAVVQMMREETGERPSMWGTSINGFESYHCKYASGREGDWPLAGVSPRKTSLTLYITPGFEAYEPLMKKLGKFKTGKSCLYINKLQDVDDAVLRELIRLSVKYMKERYPWTNSPRDGLRKRVPTG